MPQRLSLLLILLCCLSVFGCDGQAKNSAAQKALKVRLAEAVAVSVEETASFNATLAAKETVEVRAKVQGYLTERLFTEGTLAVKGTVLYKLDDRDLKTACETAKADTSKAESVWKNAAAVRDRYIPLAAKGAIGVQDRDTAVARAEEALAALNAAKAQEEKASVNLGYATITAPVTGYVNRSAVEPGALVQESNTLLTTMYRTDLIRAEFSITDREFIRFSTLIRERGGDPKKLVFRLALGDERVPYEYEGVLEMADPVVDSKTNTMGVRVDFPNPDNTLRPGLYVVVTGILGTREVVTVPEAAVLDRGGGKAVFTVDDKSTLVAVPVETGGPRGKDRIILKGLAAGQSVVVEGLVAAQPGMKVEAVPPAPTAN
ncbi:MAG: efflux RND transporter periplasmic adaptor subunit [Desulfovibrio sp.]|nr:efflux RND transporter periplasmic adaptor subunit [Desulfovibrio sp.]